MASSWFLFTQLRCNLLAMCILCVRCFSRPFQETGLGLENIGRLRSSARRGKWKGRVEEVLNKEDGNTNFICAYCIACGVKVVWEP